MLVRNIMVETGARMVTVLAGFLFVPISVSYLGVEGFGTWESIVAVANLGVILFAPAASCVIWVVASNPAEGRLRAARSMTIQALGYCTVVTLLLSSFVILLGSQLVRWLQLPPLPSGLMGSGHHILGLACFAQGLIGASDCFGYALGGLGRLRHATLVRTGGLMVNYGVSILCLTQGMGLTSPLLGLLAMGICGLALNSFLLFRGSAGASTSSASLFSLSTVRYGSTLLVGCFAGIGKDSADRIISSGMASPVFTATLGLANRLTIMLGEVNRYAYTPLIPAVAAASAQGNLERVHMLFDRCMAFNAFASGLLTAILVANSDLLLRAWTGVSPEGGHTVTVTVAAGVVMQLMMTGPATAVLRGLGKVREETTYVALSLVLNVALSLVLIPLLQAYGKILATSLALAASSLVFVGLVRRSRILPMAPFFRSFLLYAVALSVGFTFDVLRRQLLGPIPPRAMSVVGLGCLLVPAASFGAVSLVALPNLRHQLRWLVDRLTPALGKLR